MDMVRWNTADTGAVRHGEPAVGPHAVAIPLLAAAVIALILVWRGPASALLPAFGLAALAIAGGLALAAWLLRIECRTEHVNLWDLAGACALVGFATGIIGEPDHVLQLFGMSGAR